MAKSKPKAAAPAAGGGKSAPRRRGWRIAIVTFKWCRISLLLLIFTIIVLGLFLNHVGLPDWVENRIRQRLQDEGWETSFSRVRLRWYHGIVIEDLQLHRAKGTGTNATDGILGPHLFIKSAEFRPNWSALRDLRLESEGVALHDGRLIWPIASTNRLPRTLVLNQLGGELLFKPGDVWELKFLESTAFGAHVRFRGEVTNASRIQYWKMPKTKGPKGAAPGNTWNQLVADLEKFRFDGHPSAQIILNGDARDWRAFDVNVRVTAPGVHSPWTSGTNVALVARSLPPTATNDLMRFNVQINAEAATTPWADASRLEVTLEGAPSLEHFLPTNATFSTHLTDARTKWGQFKKLNIDATSRPEGEQSEFRDTRLVVDGDGFVAPWGSSAHFAARLALRHGGTNYLPSQLDSRFEADQLQTRWITSQWARVEAKLDLPPEDQFALFATNATWLERITNLPFKVTADVSNAVTAGYVVDAGGTVVDWQPPEARVFATVASGEAIIAAGVTGNTETRLITFTNSSQVRPAAFAQYLTPNAQRWLAEFDSLEVPSLEGGGRFVLPSLTQGPTNWQSEVLPSLEASARLEMPSATFRGIELTSVVIPFTLTNRVWEFADVRLQRAEGGVRLQARANENSGEFRVNAHSTINPLALQPAFTNAGRVFSMFVVSNEPPKVEAQLSGNWRDWSTLQAVGDIALTNIAFREVPISGCTAHITYASNWLSILQPVVVRPGERGTADGVAIDLAEPRLYLTNASGRLSALAIGQTIGPITKRTIEPYQFEVPPNARAEGTIPLGRANRGTENMRFEVDGGRFHWNVLNLERVKATILWRGDLLTITNASGLWHGGTMDGWVDFDFDAPRGGSMRFDASFQGNSLNPILSDFQGGKTNRLEGTIGGRLRVIRADVNNLKSWDGEGVIQLQEGLIWDIPIFGLFSPILNVVVPGLGNSRAKEGHATFKMTNSVVHSRDLEIVANATRLRYSGAVDFDGNVSAIVEAELLREIPGIGPVISTVFWPVSKLFKYSITGTLANPKPEPVYVVPRILTLPFLPFKVIKEIMNPDHHTDETQPPKRTEPKR